MKKFYFLLIALLCSATMAFAYDVQIDGICYNLNDETQTAEVTYQYERSYDNYSNVTSISIPSTILYGGVSYNVTSIGKYAFYLCEMLTLIDIPNSITSIGGSAFGETLWLNNQPDGCVYINNILYTYKGGMRVNTHIDVKEGTTQICDYAFQYCFFLPSITIPTSVISIGDYAFSGCSSLTSITIPNSVTSIGDYAFSGCSSLTSITIPNSVTSIGDGVFSKCTSLSSAIIGSGITSISWVAFDGCSSLSLITLPNSVVSIETCAFQGCSSLQSIIIPTSVTSIGNSAFYECTSLTSITIPNSVTTIGSEAFYGTPWLDNQPDGCVYINNLLYVYKGDMLANMHIDVKEGTTKICDDAFKGCSLLASIKIPSSVTYIGAYAFDGCSSLISTDIPNSITSLRAYAFRGTPWLNNQPDGCIYVGKCLYIYKGEMPVNTHIDVEEGTTMICDYAFEVISSLESIMIPNSVMSIGEGAFVGCTSLTSVIIGNGVTFIGWCAFLDCSSLSSLEIRAINPPVLEGFVFDGVPEFVEVKVPCVSVVEYQRAVDWKELVNYFGISPVLTIEVNDVTMGLVTITKQNTCEDNVAQVQAQALAGYEFVRWSDGATENPHILLVTEDMTITAEFAPIGTETFVENLDGSTINIYSNNGVLYVDGLSADYQVFDVNGRLVYTGRDVQLSLPRGVYVVNVGGEVQKVVI